MGATFPQNSSQAPIEAGNVQWTRDIDIALSDSKKSGRPVLALFQEIPGCHGCKTFGAEVLSQPLVVEAIESLFHPVLIYNNRPGSKDNDILKRFAEPAWNYQVIRFLDSSGKDIIPRRDKIWDIGGVTRRMIKALKKSEQEIPLYLHGLYLENDASHHQTAGFAMACFWTGEFIFGGIEGVVSTEAGWYDNREITLVTYHDGVTSLQNLIDIGSKNKCVQKVYIEQSQKDQIPTTHSAVFQQQYYQIAQPDDQKKQINRIGWVFDIPHLTPLQLTKLNSYLRVDQKKALQWLSPRQKKRLSHVLQ